MIDSISPPLRKAFALFLLVVAAWTLIVIAVRVVDLRIGIASEIAQLRRLDAELWKRRVDIPSLEKQLSRLTEISAERKSAIIADTDRSAVAQLQQIVLKVLKEAGATPLALTESSANPVQGAPTVSVQLRTRVSETMLGRLIAAIEGGAFPVWLEEVSAVSRGQTLQPINEVEVMAVLRAEWIRQRPHSP